MSTGAALLSAVVLAALIVTAWSKPLRKVVTGWISHDRKGRLTVALSPGHRTTSRSKKGRGRR